MTKWQLILRALRRGVLGVTLLTPVSFGLAPEAHANHPVLVEGNNCADGGPGVTTVPVGTCGDFDGDGLIGTAEDADNATDRIFGTITAALAMANNGANQNGRVTIVTSGRFAEQVLITGANGNVTLEAAPGVEADIDAVLSGDANNVTRQGQPGLVVDAPNTRIITLRNLVVRNWTEGIQVLGSSRVVIDDCRAENNRDYGVHVFQGTSANPGTGKATITDTEVNASGFRVNAAVDNTPNPGIGIEFEDSGTGIVVDTTISGSFAAGLANSTGNNSAVAVRDLRLFDNNPNVTGKVAKLKDNK